MSRGYVLENQQTVDRVHRWTGQTLATALDEVRAGNSAKYLLKSGQDDDLLFVLDHIDDLEIVPMLARGELVDARRPDRQASVSTPRPVLSKDACAE